MVVKFPYEDHAAISAVAVAAVPASATEAVDGNARPWRADTEYTFEVLVDVISSRSALSGPGNDGQRFAHLQSIIHTDIGREEFGQGMTVFWRILVDEPDAFPMEFWQLFSAVESHRAGRKMSTGLCRYGMEEAHHRGGYGTVEAAVGGGQPRGEAVRRRRTRSNEARRTESTNAARDRQLARYRGLLKRL